MRRHSLGSVGCRLVAVAMAACSLAACSTMNFGSGMGSSFGPSQPDVAAVAEFGNYTADQALTEARAHFRNNDFGYSAALYKQVVAVSPKNPEGYVGLGASYDRLGRFDLSDRVYASLYELSGGTAQYYNNLGYSDLLRGNLTAALANFNKAKKLNPTSVVIADNLQILANAARA